MLDSGASCSLITTGKLNLKSKLIKTKKIKNIWKTCGNSKYTTDSKSIIDFTLPEFTTTPKISWNFFLTKQSTALGGYDCILGRDLLKELKINLNFKTGIVEWNELRVPMKDYNSVRDLLHGEVNTLFTDLLDSTHIDKMNKRTTRILDAKYEKADIDEYLREYDHLSSDDRTCLRALLSKYETLFDGTLGKWNRKPVSLTLKPNSKLVQCRPFAIPHFHEEKLKK